MPMTHQITDETAVFTQLPGALTVRDTGGLHDCCIIAHVINDPDEPVIEDRMWNVEDVLHGGDRRPPG